MTGSGNFSPPADWTRPPGYKKRSTRRRRWPWIAGAAVVTVFAIGLVAPDNTKQTDDQAAAVVGSAAPAATATSSTPPATTSSSETPAPAPSTAAAIASAGQAQTALDLLDTLAVKGRAPKTGYTRAEFGQAWSDDVDVEGGHNGCDTRNDVLRRDLTAIVARTGSRGCVVATGLLSDPYTGTRIDFVRGEKTSQAVQIDHVVALSDAWQKGAQQLTADERRDFANDPRNLQATDGPTNQRKGDGDAATWLPPTKAYRCTYVSRQVAVKAAYRLWVTRAEKDAIARVLTGCGAVVPTPTAPSEPSRTQTQTPVPRPRPAPRYTPPPPAPVVPAVPDDSSVYYANCTAARAAGAAPISIGEPGYRPALDRDGDGTACDKG